MGVLYQEIHCSGAILVKTGFSGVALPDYKDVVVFTRINQAEIDICEKTRIFQSAIRVP